MKKVVYFTIGLLLFSSMAAIGIGDGAGEDQEIINVSFSNLEVINSVEDYIEINMAGASGRLYETSQPVLPSYTKTVVLPFGIDVTNAVCQVGTIKTESLSKKIVPAPTPVRPSISDDQEAEYIMDSNIYETSDLFPDNWFSYKVGVGLDECKDHRSFLTVNVYPVRYSPTNDEVQYVENVQVTISYTIPDDPFPSTQQYKLVIIAPQAFAGELQKFMIYIQNHSLNSDKRIIWYDSMLEDGSIQWQNGLTEQNKNFFQLDDEVVSDKMFLNFDWSADSLDSSRSIANSLNRSEYELYAGSKQ